MQREADVNTAQGEVRHVEGSLEQAVVCEWTCPLTSANLGVGRIHPGEGQGPGKSPCISTSGEIVVHLSLKAMT